MSVAVCLFLLLSCSTAGQAAPTSALATPQVPRSSGIGGSLLVKRTSSSPPPPLRWSLRRQRTDWQPVPPNPIHPAAPLAPNVLGDSTALPSHHPAAGPSADATVPNVSTKRPYKANRRRAGSLKNDPIAKAMAIQEDHARFKRTARTCLGRLQYATETQEEHRAVQNSRHKRWRDALNPEQRADVGQRRKESTRRWRERERAKQRGNSSPGPPIRRQGRKAMDWEQKRAGPQDVRQHAPTDARMEEAERRVVDGPHAPAGAHSPPATLRLKTPESLLGFWSVPPSPLPEASHHGFVTGPPFSPLDPALPRQIRASRQVLPPPTTPMEEERLRLTLAPPGEHDRLRLTLAPPRHDSKAETISIRSLE